MAPCKHRRPAQFDTSTYGDPGTFVRRIRAVFFVYSYFLCILIANAPWYIEVISAKVRTSREVFYRLQVHVIDISPYQQPVIDTLTLTSVQLDMHSRDQVEDT